MRERYRVTAALGIVQILTWGSSFYLLAVLGAPIMAETGWPRPAVMGGVSVALLASAFTAPRVGRIIAARGGRYVLSRGVVTLALGLAALGMAPNVSIYLAIWALIGCAMAASLYEAAFSTLGRLYGVSARGAITALTLWAGFASTICWPLSALLAETFGWRLTCLIYAALHLAITLPLVRFGLPADRKAEEIKTKGVAPIAWSDPRLITLAVAGVCMAFVFATISVHLIPLLLAQGYALAVAVGLGAVIGPAQVGARLLEMLGRERHAPVVTLIVASGCVATGLAGLAASLWAAICLVIYGCGTGLWSIARGTVPLASFGADGYPAVMGKIAVPVIGASAVAPILGAIVTDSVGPEATLTLLLGVAGVAFIAALAHWRITR
ncbi:MFS transporter [Gymnodinialimonas sp. 2305UL16-5]|uniref:MFS transporter n=1 Tax=Gymnodinialimonas mytili TaxID=3126503 RepID=UPI0030ADE3DC